MDLQAIRLPAPGDVVGDYRILGLIGDGGQGRVYRAEAFGKSYALKFIERGFDRWGEREVQALLALKHLKLPGVVCFIACGRWPDLDRGIFYVVMEYVEGLTLHDFALIHNPSARKAGELVLSLGRTLLAVQEAGVLHRDVKPENIMVRLPGEEPVVLDFGLAALAGARSSAGAGHVTGTLEYLSPEAWRHARDEEERYRPTPRDEQWALGVTFYWLLTDWLPFGAREDPLMTRRVLRETPKAPHVINPRVPPELGAICMRLLEKQPEDRYADLREMCGELRRVLAAPVGVATWDAPLGQPDAPECRTTEIDKTVLAEHGIDLALLKIRPPRRGRVVRLPVLPAVPLPEPEPVRGPEDATAEAVPVPVPVEAPSRRAAAWAMMLALGLVMVPLLAEAPSQPSGGQPGGEAASSAAWQVGSPVQKLAIPLRAPESGDDASPNPASVVEATLSKDAPDVETSVKKRGHGLAKKTAAAAVAAMALGCPSAQVRPPPEPMECPPGALENMEKLGLEQGDSSALYLEPHTEAVPPIPVKEGWASFRPVGQWPSEKMPYVKRLAGKVLFGGERVYGRFTQATLSDGTTLRVCMELLDSTDFKRGLKCEPTRSPGTVKVHPYGYAKVVDRFE
jgi:serine/threonine-protein kinase